MNSADQVSYGSPFYADLAGSVEKRLGLPDGLLRAIVTRGERSNADQVSEAGARSVFQIVPATRKAALDKFGIDAYLSPENAADVAGRLLKESLDRNRGNIMAAVAEYHGGTDQENWGPRTRAYVNRVMTGLRAMESSSTNGGEASGAPSIAKVYQAYRDGRMRPEQEATFEEAVQAGDIELPRGASLKRKEEEPGAPVAPDALIKAYADGKLPPEKAAIFEQALQAGELALPPGVELPRRPRAADASEEKGLGTRLAAVPGAVVEAVTGKERSTPETESLPEWTSMPELNELSVASAKSGLGTLLAPTAEVPKIIQAQFPGVKVRQDDKGNPILRSSVDGKEYAIPPGLTWGDLPRVLGAFAAFTPAGRAVTLPGMAGAAGATQAAIEASQAATGGDFNLSDVGLAAGLGAAAPLVARGVQGTWNAAARALQKLRGRSESTPAAPMEAAGASGAAPAAEGALPASGPVTPAPSAAGSTASARPQVFRESAPTPSPANPDAPSGQAAKELVDTARKAATGVMGRKAAAERLAIQAQPNRDVVQAAERLKMELDPDHVTDNEQFRKLAALARSEAGSEAESQGIATLEKASQAADDALAEIGATRDLASLSTKVRATLAATRNDLQEASDRLYAQVDAAIPQSTKVEAPALRAHLEKLKEELGGPKGLSPQESRLAALVGSDDEVLTYARLARERSLVGKALENRTSPYSSMEEGALKRLYGALADDQLNAVTSLGGQALRDKYRLAAQTVAKRKALEKRIVRAFGQDGEGNIVAALRNGIASAARGDDKGLGKLLTTVPEPLRKEALASAILTHTTKGTANGRFGFDAYAKLYRGLRENSPVYATVVRTLGEGSNELLSDLYKVSSYVAKAQGSILRTGKANQALMQGPESLVGRVLAAARGRIVRGIATETATSMAFGPTGGGFMLGAMQAATGGRKEALKAVGELLASREFRELIRQAATRESVPEAAARRVARTHQMRRFARLVSSQLAKDVEQRERWLLAPLEGGRQVGSGGSDRPAPTPARAM